MKLLVDTDTAADDAVAILLALRTPGVEVLALTTVAGNVHVDQSTANALVTLDVAGRLDVPVHQGAAAPLLASLEHATDVHGHDGLGGNDFPPVGAAHAEPTLDATLALLRAHGPDLTWVALGPLTNVALAVLTDPEACRRVRRLVVMGGVGDGVGNVTPAAEFNFWADPEAARIVLRAGLPLWLVGWDVSRRDALVGEADLEVLRLSHDPAAQFTVAVTRTLYEFTAAKHHAGAMDLPDPIAMAAALEPEHATWRRVHADVETHGELTRGAVVVDHLATTGLAPNVDLCTGFDPARFRALLLERLTTAVQA